MKPRESDQRPRGGSAWRDPAPPCSEFPHLDAVANCTVCTRPFSAQRIGVSEDGRAVCIPCAWEHEITLINRQFAGDEEPAFSGGFLQGLETLLFRPSRIFNRPSPTRVWPALIFGYVMTLLGYAAWMAWLQHLYPEWISERLADAGIDTTDSMWLAWLILPVHSLIRIFGGTLALHAGCLLAGGVGRSFNESLRAFCLASASMLFCVIPQYGPLLTVLWWSWIVLAWMRSNWNFGIGRTLIALVPSILVLPLLGPAVPTGG